MTVFQRFTQFEGIQTWRSGIFFLCRSQTNLENWAGFF